mmetsp:Transcript_30800/g.94428  ORF Transcript_30800/g.94428 Transcript_30800/m.94428 type:complete len:80 (+) Transcript_30800:867-1106(+)
MPHGNAPFAARLSNDPTPTVTPRSSRLHTLNGTPPPSLVPWSVRRVGVSLVLLLLFVAVARVAEEVTDLQDLQWRADDT